MQIIVGALGATCFFLVLALVALFSAYRNSNQHFDVIAARLLLIEQRFAQLSIAPVINLITLGLKNSGVTTDVARLKLSINPEEIRVKAETLRNRLLEKLETAKRVYGDTPNTYAWVILDHSGARAVLDVKSGDEAQQALNRFLVNGDEDGARRFLVTLADSVAAAEMTIPQAS